MFTVKHISIGGDENLYQSQTVHFEPRRLQGGMPSYVPGTVQGPDVPLPPYVHLDEALLSGGTIFVMNEKGKTVARYDLGASPVPLSVTDANRTARAEYDAALHAPVAPEPLPGKRAA